MNRIGPCATSNRTIPVDDDRDGSGRWRRPARPEAERSLHRTRKGLCRRTCCMTGGGPKSTCATPRAGVAARRRCAAAGFACAARCHTEVPEITAPHIPGAGSPGPRSLAGFTVGTVVRITCRRRRGLRGARRRCAADRRGRRGPHPDGRPAARSRDRHCRTGCDRSIADGRCAARRHVSHHAGATIGAAGHPVLCARWEPGGPLGYANTAVLVGNSLPLDSGDTAATLAQADGDGPNIDAVYLPPGPAACPVGRHHR